MTTYGLMTSGFLPKSQDTCRSEMSVSVQGKRGPSTDVSDGSWIGMLIGILSEREATLWDLGQAIYASRDPDQATGALQDAVCSLTGTRRAAARSSLVTETFTGTPTTVVPSGTQIKTASTGALFSSLANCTIVAVAAWAGAHNYTNARSGATLGDRVTNAGRVYECITAGTSAGAGGPTTTALDILDNTMHWRYLGDGTGAIDATCGSTVKDAIVAVSGDLTQIMTPVGGLNGASNVLDAVVGALKQPDALLRLTREAELSNGGNSPPDAIRAAILDVTGVTSCTVFANDTDLVDANGQAPHSIQALVEGGDDTAIATVLSQNVAGGIPTVSSGGTPVAIVLPDSEGVSQTWIFSRPAQTLIYVDATYTYDPRAAAQGGYPSDGDAESQLAIATFGNALPEGKDVVASSLGACIFPLFVNGSQVAGVPGILDVTLVKIGLAPAPGSSTTLVIDAFHRAAFDTSRITIHSSPGSF